MNKVILLLVIGFCMISCNDYVSSKRDGLKPYPEHEKQAEESKE